MVLPQQEEYSFLIESRGELDLFVLSTCHRIISIEEAGEGGIFGNKKKVRVKYRPVLGLEDEACPVILEGFEVSPGRHSFGFIDFQEKKMLGVGRLQCNGRETPVTGVGICQGQAGTVQQIIFEKPMMFAGDCEGVTEDNPQRFKIFLSRGVCTFGFAEKEHRENKFRLTTIGFEEILIRKN